MLRLGTLMALAGRLLPPVFGGLPAPRGGMAVFPPCLAWLGVEVRLDADGTIDLATNIEGVGPGRRVVAASEGALREALPPAWWPTLAVLADWASGRDPALAPVTELWFEVDAGGEGRPPIVFLTLVDMATQDVRRVLASPALRSLGAADAVVDRFARMHAAWPAELQLHHVASLAPRGSPALRVVASTPVELLLPTIEALGWQGDASAVRGLLAALGDHSGRVTFDLDLEDGPSRRLGIEWYLPTMPAGDPRWRRALDVAGELAGGRPDRIAAAEAWANDPVGVGRVGVRRYFQLKFVLRPDIGWTAKAYLGVRPRLAG